MFKKYYSGILSPTSVHKKAPEKIWKLNIEKLTIRFK